MSRPPPSTLSAPTIQQSTSSSSRSRANPRKKYATTNEDVAYLAYTSPSSSSVPAHNNSNNNKRSAQTEDAAPPRPKRPKRADNPNTNGDPLGPSPMQLSSAAGGANHNPSLIDFSTLSTAELHRYIAHHDIVPVVNPSPLSPRDPPPPSSLLSLSPSSATAASAATTRARPSPPPNPNRRRSSRVLDDNLTNDDAPPPRAAIPPILSDVQAVHSVLAQIAQRHADGLGPGRDVDVLAGFVAAVRAEDGFGYGFGSGVDR